MAFSPGNLSTSSSASSTLGSPENEEYILSFETIDKMRRVSSYSSLNSLIGECPCALPATPRPLRVPSAGCCWVLAQKLWQLRVCSKSWTILSVVFTQPRVDPWPQNQGFWFGLWLS